MRAGEQGGDRGRPRAPRSGKREQTRNPTPPARSPPPARAWGDKHRFKIHFLLIFLCIMECLFFAEMR